MAALPGYRYHLVQVAGCGSAPAGNKEGDVSAPWMGVTLKRIPDSAHFIMWDQAEVEAFLGPR